MQASSMKGNRSTILMQRAENSQQPIARYEDLGWTWAPALVSKGQSRLNGPLVQEHPCLICKTSSRSLMRRKA